MVSTTRPEPCFPRAAFHSHMPFLRGDTLLFCNAEEPVEHTFVQEGVIWDRIDRKPELQARFAGVSRTRVLAFRRWKLQAVQWQSRQHHPISTGLPPEAVECCPTFFEQDGVYHVSFIGGIPTSRKIEYHLYQMSGPALNKLCASS